MRRVLILLFVVALIVAAVPTWADAFGLIPTLTKADKAKKPPVVTASAVPASLPELPGKKPIIVVGLEAISWYGPNASVAFGVTGKRELGGGWKTVNGKFYYGWLVGITDGDAGGNVATGGVLQLAIGDIPAFSVLLRPKNGGWLVNPGVNFTLIGKAF